ncbi:hypothetical protein SLS60_011160 [Paraconiothyrium brasiliense]|uniref:BTB domain-containing protein n=1 Tax=Paraconiothyrium brasiliense TaxID=300254 RepID=A0ABR3QKR6_9PLEO
MATKSASAGARSVGAALGYLWYEIHNANAFCFDSLFNNPTLSDVKIKQIFKGKVREYHAHKQILARGSKFFLNAFTGNFKEAHDNVMEVHDDVPEHFEIALMYLYTDVYDEAAVTRLAAQDDEKRVRIPIELFVVADKYGIDRLAKLAANDVGVTLTPILAPSGHRKLREDMVEAAIQECYQTLLTADTILGRCLSAAVIDHYKIFILSEKMKDLIRQYPSFAVDLALKLHERGTLGVEK